MLASSVTVPTIAAAALRSAPNLDPSARWIGRELPEKPATPKNQAPAPIFRRTFEIETGVTSARLLVAAYGYYSAEINGSPISDAVLDPAPSQFDRTVFSRSIDITHLIRPGWNAIGVMLGRSYVSGIAGPGTPWIAEPRLLAQLDIDLAGGRSMRLVSDATWKIGDSGIRDWMYFGEHHDSRAHPSGWSTPEFDDAAWKSAPVHPSPTRAIVEAKAPPVVVTDTWKPKSKKVLGDGSSLYDFGRITAGWVELVVSGEPGTKVEISYGQQLAADGSVALCLPWGSTDPDLRQHVDTYVLSGGALESWEPRFTRHGFQFVQIKVLSGKIKGCEVQARECHTPSPASGSFSCSSALVNQMHENHRRSLLLNHWGFPTDTSHRDRQGWTADTHCYMDAGLLNFSGFKDVYVDWLRTLRDTQQADGSIAAFAPNTLSFPAFNDPSWGGMIVLIPWRLYQYTGEVELLTENYPAMAAWMDLMDRTISATGDLYEGFSFGDHGPPGAENSGTMNIGNIEGPEVTRNAHLYHEARVLAQIARLLDKSGDAKRFDAMADRILPAFNRTYFHQQTKEYRTPKQAGYRQTSNLLPLAFDMVPPDLRAAVFEALVADIESRGRTLNTGALGTKLILPVLMRFGRADLAWALVSQTRYPSWGYWVEQGATTSWEVWRNKSLEQTLDHPFLGAFDEWLFQHLAGIQAETPGYRKLRIAPYFPADLDRAEATVSTPKGSVSSSWQRDRDGILLDLEIPSQGKGELVLNYPADQITIIAGRVTSISKSKAGTVFALNSERTTIRVSV